MTSSVAEGKGCDETIRPLPGSDPAWRALDGVPAPCLLLTGALAAAPRPEVASTATAAPATRFATYLGGAGNDLITGIAADDQGNKYVAGTTDKASAFPTKNPLPGIPGGGRDLFVTKYDPAGQVLWSLTYGGS